MWFWLSAVIIKWLSGKILYFTFFKNFRFALCKSREVYKSICSMHRCFSPKRSGVNRWVMLERLLDPKLLLPAGKGGPTYWDAFSPPVARRNLSLWWNLPAVMISLMFLLYYCHELFLHSASTTQMSKSVLTDLCINTVTAYNSTVVVMLLLYPHAI